MTANAKATKHGRTPGTLEGIRPGESLDDFERRVGDDIPEATEEDFKRARPISDFPELLEAINNARARGQRGPQKSPTKERVALRLDTAIVDHFRSGGPGWQTRINDALAALVRKSDQR
jgi:uncharacterized protein (DUF4415 family)